MMATVLKVQLVKFVAISQELDVKQETDLAFSPSAHELVAVP